MLEELSAISQRLRLSDEEGGMRMLASVVSASREFVGIADLEGNALFVNEAGRNLVGLRDLNAVRETQIIDYFAPEDHDKILNEVMPAVRATGYWEGELTFRNFHTSQPIPVLYNIFPIRDSAGAITAYGTVTRNLTDSKLADQRLRYLASIVESSDDAIVSKNLDGIITSWNSGAEHTFGYTAEEAVGQPIIIVIPEDRRSEEIEIISRIRRGERIDHFETVRRSKNGGLIDVSLTVSPVKDDRGRIVGASKIARDITEQRRSQERIAALAHEAEHRSKNLLTTVRALVNLSRGDTPGDLKNAIEGRIRALANVNSIFVETRWHGAELTAIANEELAPFAGKNKLRVRVDGPPTLLEPSKAQAVAVILHELATNAAKYGSLSGPAGNLDLTWRQENDGQVAIRWREFDGPPAQKPSREGFGTKVIQQMIRQLEGEARFDWSAAGLDCEIKFRMRD